MNYEKLGKKILYLRNGGIYFGGLFNSRPHGYGLFWYNSGAVYCGFWENGMPHKWGYFYNPSESTWFFGKISYGMAQGKGMLWKFIPKNRSKN